MKLRYLIHSVCFTLLTLSIAGCSNEQASKTAIPTKVKQYKTLKTLTGRISNEKGAVVEGQLQVKDSQGNLVAVAQLNGKKQYSIDIPAGTFLPLVLTVNSDSLAEPLTAVIISPVVSQYDISTLTTKIAQRAKALGGYTYSNMVLAADSTVGVPDANKTSTGFRGDPTKQYGGWH